MTRLAFSLSSALFFRYRTGMGERSGQGDSVRSTGPSEPGCTLIDAGCPPTTWLANQLWLGVKRGVAVASSKDWGAKIGKMTLTWMDGGLFLLFSTLTRTRTVQLQLAQLVSKRVMNLLVGLLVFLGEFELPSLVWLVHPVPFGQGIHIEGRCGQLRTDGQWRHMYPYTLRILPRRGRVKTQSPV
ncbi:hypothetical protein V8F06_007932 [Rhypophila decipiens]